MNMKRYYLLMCGFLFFSTFVLSSCSTKMPALERDGEPLKLVEYEKIAQKEFENDRYKNAILVYEAIITHYPDNYQALAWAHYEIGFCYFMLGDFEKAGSYFRKVINEFQEPAATQLAQHMMAKIVESKKKQ